jgi:hypothetical protein
VRYGWLWYGLVLFMIEVVDWGAARFEKEFEGLRVEFDRLRERIVDMFGQISGAPHAPLDHQMRLSNNSDLCGWFAVCEKFIRMSTAFRDFAAGRPNDYGESPNRSWQEHDQGYCDNLAKELWGSVQRCRRYLETKFVGAWSAGV